MSCLQCGSEQDEDAGECAGCSAPVDGRPAGPGALLTGRGGSQLRVDMNGITVRNSRRGDNVSRVIAWDEVRWLRDGEAVSRRTGWSLEIVLKDGALVWAEASASGRPAANPPVLHAIRQAARDHGVPAVLTGRPVGRCRPGLPQKAGLYPDPGGEPGLREWDGTEWSPVLRTDPGDAGPGGTAELAMTWSPLPRQAQQPGGSLTGG